jgi:hypothetical protein
MGAEASTLNSFHSLSESLSQIERRLESIESYQQENSLISSSADHVIVSGRTILTNPCISFSIEPVIGLVKATSVRIMLEINQSASISLNFFQTADLSHDAPPVFIFHKVSCKQPYHSLMLLS